MKVLVVGSGGREHAIVEALARSTYKPKIYAVMGNLNPGIKRKAADYLLEKETNVPIVAQYAADKAVDFAVIGPEAPLAAGLVDALYDLGIPTASPLKDAARLEFDKAWTRSFMARNGIEGTPKFRVFSDPGDAYRYLEEFPDYMTQGETVEELQENLKDLFEELTSGNIPGVRRVAELRIA